MCTAQGTLGTAGGGQRRIVLKRVKDRVAGAQEMAEMEHLLNVYASSACKRSVAPFLGYIDVPEPRGRLTKGLWLAWEYEGDKTLAYYLRRRDCIAALASDLGLGSEDDVIPTVMEQIFRALVDVHAAGLVHRDIKPANLVFCDDERRFKLIDLGAAADLRTGTNYKPQETILDPLYCPPEEYVLPTDAPHLSRQAAPLALVMSPLLWQQHRPDCFDTWSAGVILLQLGLPFLRSTTSLRNWRTTFARCDYDLDTWRSRAGLSGKQTALLDSKDGAGWDLAAALLRPREVEFTGKGGVRFVNTGVAPRLTPSAALSHRFLKSRREFQFTFGKSLRDNKGGTGSNNATEILEIDSGSAATPFNTIKSGWGWLKSKVLDLEARITQQVSETEAQTTAVKKLREDVAAGKATKQELEKEEGVLRSMQSALQASTRELRALYSSAGKFLSIASQPTGNDTAALASTSESDVDSYSDSGSGSVSPTSQPRASQPRASQPPTESAVAKSVAEVATNVIYSSLKLTASALTAVSDFASAAERGIARAQEEAETRRVATTAFVEALKVLKNENRINVASTWDLVRPLVPESEEYAILSESQRRRAFTIYLESLQRERRMALTAAKEIFGKLFVDYPPLLEDEPSFDDYADGPVSKDSRFLAVVDEEVRREAFAFCVKALLAAKAKKETSPPPGAPATTLENSQSVTDAEQLDALRAEQARLKEEYERMQEKLDEMERQLLAQNALGTLIESSGSESKAVVEAEPDGAVVFKFADSPVESKGKSKGKSKVKSNNGSLP